ncbi:hypothetical protein [Cellulosimicrobium sp. NPDC057862]|uniref:hypothetical protein n=1 Tax=Cellulosimicrobium sp. NPDC057862 TaxID=3346266 RepID=UPI003671FE47
MVEIMIGVRDWQRIDGTLDNTGATERVGGDEELAAAAGRLREVGWAVAAAHPAVGLGRGGWPPTTETLAIRMSRADWQMVAAELRRWADVADGLDEDETREEAATQRRIANLVSTCLDEER